MVAMRTAGSLLFAAGFMAAMASCAFVGPPGPAFSIECREADVGIEIGAPLPMRECDAVVELVVSRFGSEDPELGTLILIAVEVVDCAVAGREAGVVEMTEPGVDKCWRVHRDHVGGSVVLHAAREEDTGEISLIP
jgi:hypothetical protein